MPNARLVATEPADGKYIELITGAYIKARPTIMLSAIAYATHGGVAELIGNLEHSEGWGRVRKKWLVGIDFCRSNPVALKHLDNLPKSETRIFDGVFVVGRKGCVPRTSFHPKLYVFRRNAESVVVAGSGNLSHTGLCVGVEAGLSVSGMARNNSRHLVGWFNRQWQLATPLKDISDTYERRYEALENRKYPTPTEDDVAPESAGNRGQLTGVQLRKLSVCNHLWIHAGNLHLNLGPGRAGNQLMLKRNTRMFFGFPARDLDPDTLVGHVALEYGGHVRPACSLRFSNNSMDVLTLPIPRIEGPTKYDQETLCFEKTNVRQFRLVIGNRNEIVQWKRQSRKIGAHFKMSSGREWGVF